MTNPLIDDYFRGQGAWRTPSDYTERAWKYHEVITAARNLARTMHTHHASYHASYQANADVFNALAALDRAIKSLNPT